MNDNESLMSETIQSPDKNTVKGPGVLLQEARIALGLSEEDIAKQLRLSNRIIIALEKDEYGQLPGIAFAKGYLRAYARVVGLSGDEIIAKLTLLGYKEPELITTPHTTSTTGYFEFMSNKGEKIIRWITYFILVILLILVLIWWQSNRSTDDAENEADLPLRSALEEEEGHPIDMSASLMEKTNKTQSTNSEQNTFTKPIAQDGIETSEESRVSPGQDRNSN